MGFHHQSRGSNYAIYDYEKSNSIYGVDFVMNAQSNYVNCKRTDSNHVNTRFDFTKQKHESQY